MDAPLVIFELAGQALALPAATVRECLPLPLLWRRAGLPATVAGFFSLGGEVLPVIDLGVLLGLREAASEAALYSPLLHVGRVTYLVDRLGWIGTADPERGEPGPADPWQHGCAVRHVRVNGRPVTILDPARLLLADEEIRLDALTRDAAIRDSLWFKRDEAVDAS